MTILHTVTYTIAGREFITRLSRQYRLTVRGAERIIARNVGVPQGDICVTRVSLLMDER